jgi:hypothetical protein
VRNGDKNTHSVLKDLKAELRIKDLQEDLTLQEIFEVKVLGLLWDYVQDVLKFDFTGVELAEMSIRKMKMLILLHTFYDQLGIIIPFCITGKLQVQDCWQRGLLWKDNLPLDQETAWLKWQSQIEELSTIEIPRVLTPGEKLKSTNTQLHIFVDASQNVYSAVAYMRTESVHVLGVAL